MFRAKMKIGDDLLHFVLFFFLSIFNTYLENYLLVFFLRVCISYLIFTLSIGIKLSGVAAH